MNLKEIRNLIKKANDKDLDLFMLETERALNTVKVAEIFEKSLFKTVEKIRAKFNYTPLVPESRIGQKVKFNKSEEKLLKRIISVAIITEKLLLMMEAYRYRPQKDADYSKLKEQLEKVKEEVKLEIERRKKEKTSYIG